MSRKGQGKPVDESNWPSAGPVLEWLKFCADLRRSNGTPSTRAVATRLVGWSSPNLVSELLRGVSLPTSDKQARAFLEALGGVASELDRGMLLYRNARTAWQPSSGWWERSVWREHVVRVAPDQLLGREQELSELKAFCASTDAGPYMWCQADAWAGKSALMSWFVLHSPAGVDIVPFFVTARFAGQNDRVAFTAAVVEQLALTLNQPIPTLLTDTSRELLLLRMLGEAARSCRQRSRRLVLLIDGLDEDRGATTGPDAHSIAALLPINPPAGMRVIVAGRPHPPIPNDVPDDHPLRDPGNVRTLEASPHAAVVRQDMQRELRRLLHGTGVEQDLLGLLTAAGGGLSRADLSELTDLSEWQVDEHLSAVSARSFSPRAGWRANTTVYVLGHEELQEEASRFIGPTRLDTYRQRLHVWADGYRDLHWPVSTPEYLLRGYFRMLHTIGDTTRMGALATDPDRQDRMLDVAGGDMYAVTEITTTWEAILCGELDLVMIGRLAWHRDFLFERTFYLAPDLPALWVQLGNPVRAEAQARSMNYPERRFEAFLRLIEVTSASDPDRARKIAAQAESLARSIAGRNQGGWAQVELAGALALIDPDWAEAFARSITDPDNRALALVGVAKRVAAVDPDRAETLAHSITDWRHCERALVGVVRALASSDPDRAEAIAQSLIDPDVRQEELISLRTAAGSPQEGLRRGFPLSDYEITNGQKLIEVAKELRRGRADRAEIIARTISDQSRQDKALSDVAQAFAVTDPGRAEAVACSIDDSDERCRALIGLAKALAVSDPDRARGLAMQVEAVARFRIGMDRPIQDLADVVQALSISDPDRAWGLAAQVETVARTITDQDKQDWALASVATALAASDPDRAEALARNLTGRDQSDRALAGVAERVAANDPDRAETLARSIRYDPWCQAMALAGVAKVLATGGPRQSEIFASTHIGRHKHDNSVQGRLARTLDYIVRALDGLLEVPVSTGPDRAVTMARSITDASSRDEALAGVAQALAVSDPERAEAVARSIADSNEQVRALVGVAEALATSQPNRARRLAAQAETVARSVTTRSKTHSYRQDEALRGMARALAVSDADRAEAVARSIADLEMQEAVLVGVAEVLAVSDPERAEAVARSITDRDRQSEALASIAVKVEPSRASQLLAAAWHVGDWSTALTTLARIKPAAAEAVAKHVVRMIARQLRVEVCRLPQVDTLVG